MTDVPSEIVTFSDLHFTRNFKTHFLSSLGEPIDTLIICSPFFDKLPAPFASVIEFCAIMQRRGVDDIQIVTRPPTGNDSTMSVAVAKQLNSMGIKIFVRPKPYFHVKLYHFEYSRGYFKTFVGSANFTLGGFERNTELVAELQGAGKSTACHREIARIRDSGGALPYEAWVGKGLPYGQAEMV